MCAGWDAVLISVRRRELDVIHYVVKSISRRYCWSTALIRPQFITRHLPPTGGDDAILCVPTVHHITSWQVCYNLQRSLSCTITYSQTLIQRVYAHCHWKYLSSSSSSFQSSNTHFWLRLILKWHWQFYIICINIYWHIYPKYDSSNATDYNC